MSAIRPSRRERSRQRLLDVGFTLLAQRGFDGTTASDVALAADLAVGSFYNHFTDKTALKDAVIATASAGHGALLDWATAPATDPMVRLALAVKASVLRAARLPGWAGFVIRFGLVEPVLYEVLGCGAKAGPDRATIVGLVISFSALAAEHGSDGTAEAAAVAVLRALGCDGAAAVEAARVPLPE